METGNCLHTSILVLRRPVTGPSQFLHGLPQQTIFEGAQRAGAVNGDSLVIQFVRLFIALFIRLTCTLLMLIVFSRKLLCSHALDFMLTKLIALITTWLSTISLIDFSLLRRQSCIHEVCS